MPLIDLSLLLATVFCASFVQGLVGFGFGMISVPLLITLGYSLPESVILATAASMVHVSLGSYKLRKNIPWQAVKPATFFRTLALPLGIYCLAYIDESWPIDRIRQLVGIIILVVIFLQWRQIKIKGVSGSRLASYTAFGLSGWMAGTIGMGGPPLVLWVTGQNWSAQATKSFILCTFALSLPIHFALLAWRFPSETQAILLPLGYSIVVVMGGLSLGLKLSHQWSDRRLKYIIYLVLIGISARLIIN